MDAKSPGLCIAKFRRHAILRQGFVGQADTPSRRHILALPYTFRFRMTMLAFAEHLIPSGHTIALMFPLQLQEQTNDVGRPSGYRNRTRTLIPPHAVFSARTMITGQSPTEITSSIIASQMKYRAGPKHSILPCAVPEEMLSSARTRINSGSRFPPSRFSFFIHPSYFFPP